MKGKAKKLFEEWFMNLPMSYFWGDYIAIVENGKLNRLGVFRCLPPSMQWGVYVDFFDANGITIEISKVPTLSVFYFMIDDDANEPEMFKSHPEARHHALTKANEILNERL